MSRRRKIYKRNVKLLVDDRYQSTQVAKFIAKVLKKGKKSLAERIVYDALESIYDEHKMDPMECFTSAVKNTTPLLEVTSVRVGGANYQVPAIVSDSRSFALSVRWLLQASRSRPEKSMARRIAKELFDAANNKGAAVKKREDTHRMAEANKAFAHLGPRKIKN